MCVESIQSLEFRIQDVCVHDMIDGEVTGLDSSR